MGPKTKQLIETLNKIIVLLKEDNDTQWLKWMETSRNRLVNSDYSGITHLLGAYGGMGSFNDLIIGQTTINGKLVWKENAQENNNKLDALRAEAYKLANYIKRNHEKNV